MTLEIQNLKTGDTLITNPMMIYAATLSKTKTGKDYLAVTVGNKTGKIEARMWTLPIGFALPKVGTVYTISATVTEFNGEKQLNIASMFKVPDEDVALEDYTIEVPNRLTTGAFYAYTTQIREVLIKNNSQLLIRMFDAIVDKYKDIMQSHTAACNVHHAGVGGWLKHTCEVVDYVSAIYAHMPEHTRAYIRFDLLLLGAFLHDVGKLQAYDFESGVSVMTDQGKLLEHISSGLLMLQEAFMEEFVPAEPDAARGKDDYLMLQHIIASHHGELEYGAAVNPVTLEAHIVSVADKLSADLDAIDSALTARAATDAWTQKIFTQHNRQFTTPIIFKEEANEVDG